MAACANLHIFYTYMPRDIFASRRGDFDAKTVSGPQHQEPVTTMEQL
jgi:hypothetical protein